MGVADVNENQQQFITTLDEMRGHVRRVRPGIDPLTVRDFINQRIRSALDRKAIWAGLIRRGTIQIPDAYQTGTVSLTSGSDVVTGSGTSWPVSDAVNTSCPTAITETGTQWVAPASMGGITADSVLYVDDAGTPEIVRVVAVQSTRFLAKFEKTHTAGFTIKKSSLAGRQLRLGGSYPVYTILAVTSATSATLDMPWAGASLPSSSYSILLMYVTLAPNLKHLLDVIDPVQPTQLLLHYSQQQINWEDPQRTSGGPPYALVDMGPSPAGNIQYEIYPPQYSARQLYYIYTIQWPDLVEGGDRPPYFINPNVFIYGALAQALRVRLGPNDSGYDPATANTYEQMAERDLMAAIVADDGKVQATLQWEYQRLLGSRGANWNQSHAVSYAGGNTWW